MQMRTHSLTRTRRRITHFFNWPVLYVQKNISINIIHAHTHNKQCSFSDLSDCYYTRVSNSSNTVNTMRRMIIIGEEGKKIWKVTFYEGS